MGRFIYGLFAVQTLLWTANGFGFKVGAQTVPDLTGGLSSVLDCTVGGKSGLCVPTVLKDVVCIPLGFQFAPDVKTCGSDNVCCHSNVDSKAASPTTSSPTTASSKISDQSDKGGSASILLLTAAKPEATSSAKPDSSNEDLQITSNTGNSDKISELPFNSRPSAKKPFNPRPFQIPASLSAFLPDSQQNQDADAPVTPSSSQKSSFKKLCRVGSSQGMCVKSDLVRSLCLPLGFATSPGGCDGGYMCCFTPNPDDNSVVNTASDISMKSPVNKPDTPIPSIKISAQKGKPGDMPTSMDTCMPSPGLAGLCIRSDVAPMVCTPLGYVIGSRLTCSYDRVCCYSDKITVPSQQNQPQPVQPQNFPLISNGPARPCQLGPEIVGICVPANLISSCPLFGKKVSAFGCATRHNALPNYCCYEDRRSSVSSGSDRLQSGGPEDIEPLQPFIAVAGSETVPKLDTIVCGRKGLSGIEPRALARKSRLLGAHPTLPGEFCWQATLFSSDGKPFCNGVLVHREWVLTAAHCIKRSSPAKTTVKLGVWALNTTFGRSSGIPDDIIPPIQTFRVREAFLHYSYDAVTLDNNVALLHLDNPVDVSEPQVCLVCLPSQETYEGSQCTVSSFSSPDGVTFGKDSVLSQLDVSVINSSSCESILVGTGKLQNNFRLNGDVTMCAKSGTNEDTCRGDGGSGLVCQNGDGVYEVSGLVSWGLSCGLGAPTVFTRVWLYNSWIQEIIRRYT